MITRYNKNWITIDFRKSTMTIYSNGQEQTNPLNSYDAALRFCVKNKHNAISVILLGATNETKSFFDGLAQYDINVCCYDVQQADPTRIINHSQSSLEEVLSSLHEIKTLLKREQPKSANYALINTSSPQRETKDIKELKSFISDSFEALNKKQSETNYLVTEIYNRESEVSSNGGSEVIEDLRKELAAYKNDFYQKSMMKFGVNTVIEILERLYTEKNLLMQKGNADDELDRIAQIISFCEAKMKKLNLKIRLSSEGDEFDGGRMVSFDDKVVTDDENKKGRVAYSISPAIYWTLPRVNAPGEDELLIKEETVALYE